MILDVQEGRTGRADLARRLREREERLGLEMASSHLNVWVIAELAASFPVSRYVLTVRDPLEWLVGRVNNALYRTKPKHPLRLRLRALRFPPAPPDDPERERPFLERGVESLATYLRSWASHNEAVLDAVSPERLLVVPTGEISSSFALLADFLDVPASTLTAAHSNKGASHRELLAGVDPSYLEAVVEQHCGEILRRLSPA